MHRPTRRAAPLLALCGLLLAGSLQPASTLAREWLSPTPSPSRPALASQDGAQGQADAWAGRLWAGPSAGAPAAPDAGHCRRPPATFTVDGPPGEMQRLGRVDGRRVSTPAAPGSGPLPLAKHGLAEALRPAPPPAPALEASPAWAGDTATDAVAPPRPRADARNTPQRRPADEPVSAGVVDDNADFGEYLAYLARHPQRVPRPLAVADRVRLEVRDAQGRPVPDAAVSVFAAGRAQPLWARTDAAGRAWLMPQADMDGSVFEVQVRKGGDTTRVMWQRGQKDALQAQLAARPPARAQLDVAFLIDATGSMADEIDKLKRSMRRIAHQIAQLPSRPDLCFALVAYRDRGDAFFIRGADFSNDLGALQATLAQLQAEGGGDTPEALSEALHTAVHRLSWRGEGTARLLLLVADAPPHLDRGAPHFDEELRGAQGRGVKLLAVGASGLDPTGEYTLRQAAQFTGGRFVFLTYADAHNPASGPGRDTVHEVRNYTVQTLDTLVVKLVADEMAAWPDKP